MVEIYKLDIPNIRYIYHLADIHIRLNDRIEEYTEVFRELYKSIEENSEDSRKESIIVMAGDIFDAKTNLKSESLELFDILMELLKLMPIIIIAGNHDGNMTNTKYKDALYYVTKVYDRLYDSNQIPNRLYYLDRTGFYETENMMIGVKHIFDVSNQVPNIMKIQTDKVKISIHHGTISGSKTDIGQVLESEETLNLFTGYNFVLLGDIHKRQFMGNSNTIAYPGSLIQQNYGETLEKHGYLIWDIIDYNFYEIDIKNNYGFVTLNIVKNKIKEPYNDILTSEQYPSHLNIRIRYENCSAEYLSKLRKELETKYSVLKYVEENRLSKINQMEKYMNMRGNKRFEKIIKKYMKENEIPESYYEVIMRELGEILKDSKTEHIVYSLKKLYISNILCYGEYNEIDFSKYGDTIGIFSKNYTGKSTIIDCICECLFDTNLKGISKKDILRYGCKKGYIKLLIDINGKEYMIEKIYSGRPKVNLYINNELMNDDTTVKTMKILKEQIGSIEKFRQTDCISQNDNNGIADMTKEQRKKFLKEILDLKDYSDKCKRMKERLSNIKNEITILEKENDKKSKELTNIDPFKLNKINEAISLLEEEKDKLKEEIIYIDFREVMNKSKQEIEKMIRDNENQIKYNQNRLVELRNEHISIPNQEELDIKRKKVIENETKLELLRKEMHDIKNYDIKSYDDLKKEFEEKQKLVNRLKDDISKLNDMIDDEIKYDEQIEMDNHKFLEELNDQKVKLMMLIQPLRKITTITGNVLEEYLEITEEIKRYQIKEEQLEILNREIYELKILKDKYEKYEVYLKRKEDIEKIEYNRDCEICVKNNKETIAMKDEIDLKLKELWLEEFSNINKIRRDYKDRMYKREMLEKEMKHINMEELLLKQQNIKFQKEQMEMNEENERWNMEVEKKNERYRRELNDIKEMRNEKYEEYRRRMQEQHHIMKQLDEKNKEFQKNNNELDNIEKNITDISNNRVLIEENKRKDKEIKKLAEEIENYIIIIKKSEELYEQLKCNQTEIIELEGNNNMLLEKNEQILITYDIYEKKCNNEERITNIEKEYMELMRSKINLERDIQTSIKLKEEIIKNNESLFKLYEEKDKYEILEKIFDKNGLSEYIMRTAYNDISESINFLTEKVCGYRFRIDDNTNFMIIRDNKEYYIENGSGAEKLILNIAFRMTVSNIKCISRSDMMIIDESFISFDKDNRNKIEDIIEMILTKYKRVLVISHMEELQEIIRERINIRSERGISYII
jgi:DNA repair exonuclease SbcCD ATPase subunit